MINGVLFNTECQPTISLEMPVPSQGHYGFHSFPVVDWFCLFIYLWVLTFPCTIVRSSVILLLPLFGVSIGEMVKVVYFLTIGSIPASSSNVSRHLYGLGLTKQIYTQLVYIVW